jgi:hypothetical protein
LGPIPNPQSPIPIIVKILPFIIYIVLMIGVF